MKVINLLLRFLLELAALVSVSYWGYHAAQVEWGRLILSIAAPIVFATLWGLFAAHKAKFPPPQPFKAILGAVLLEVTAVVLAVEGQSIWAGVVAVVIAVNSGMVHWWKYE